MEKYYESEESLALTNISYNMKKQHWLNMTKVINLPQPYTDFYLIDLPYK